ncbi:MAG: hypothetical protein ACRC8A_04265 [Microcoleaceae cyanobacterium]
MHLVDVNLLLGLGLDGFGQVAKKGILGDLDGFVGLLLQCLMKMRTVEEETSIQDWMFELVEQSLEEIFDDTDNGDNEIALECWRKVTQGEMPKPQEISLLCAALGIASHQELEAKLKGILNKGKLNGGS